MTTFALKLISRLVGGRFWWSKAWSSCLLCLWHPLLGGFSHSHGKYRWITVITDVVTMHTACAWAVHQQLKCGWSRTRSSCTCLKSAYCSSKYTRSRYIYVSNMYCRSSSTYCSSSHMCLSYIYVSNAHCSSSSATAWVWLKQYALKLYLLEQRIVLKRPYVFKLYLL